MSVALAQGAGPVNPAHAEITPEAPIADFRRIYQALSDGRLNSELHFAADAIHTLWSGLRAGIERESQKIEGNNQEGGSKGRIPPVQLIWYQRRLGEQHAGIHAEIDYLGTRIATSVPERGEDFVSVLRQELIPPFNILSAAISNHMKTGAPVPRVSELVPDTWVCRGDFNTRIQELFTQVIDSHSSSNFPDRSRNDNRAA